MRLLIGYSMRSGSTLLQHVLGHHSKLRSFSDLSSIPMLASLTLGWRPQNIVLKPLDLIYLYPQLSPAGLFDKFVWLSRDPRDSYLSTVDSSYAYLFWPRGEQQCGIDIGLLERWKRVYQAYFEHKDQWHKVRYEDLVERPEQTLDALYAYLGLDAEIPQRLQNFSLLSGGDYKLAQQDRIHSASAGRFESELSAEQLQIFEQHIGEEMRALGYR